MKKINFLLLIIVLFGSCQEKTPIDEKFVIAKFQENSKNLNSVEYKIQRIDTFGQDGTVWNNTGIALIEKDENDKVFGFSFYGKRDDIEKEYIYDSGNAFEFLKENKTYKMEPGYFGFIGKPGGQMVQQNIFELDSVYKKVSLIEKENTYNLKYEFEDDTVYNVTERVKIVKLSKENFFPIMVKSTSKQLGQKSVSQTAVYDLKINESVLGSIQDLKNQFYDFTIIEPQERQPNKLLGKDLPILQLPELFNKNNIVTVSSGKLILLDFWEVWCGPCIASFPKVENLKNQFSSELLVIGIVSEDTKNAIKLIEKKGTTFQNLVGDEALKKTFGIDSFPRYFLVDRSGTVQKEYFGFSEQIEKDIKATLAKS